MRDLEERLRAEVLRRANRFEPSADLPDRIHGQVRRQRRRRQALAGGIYVGVAAALVLVVAVAWSGLSDTNAVVTEEGPRTPPTSASITPPPTTAPATPTIDPSTPLSRSGAGPIVAGMTLREAAAAAGVVITPSSPAPEYPCIVASLHGSGGNLDLLAERSGGPGADPMESVIRVVTVVVEGSTEEGVAIGDPVANLTTAYGAPTRTYDEWDGPGSQYLVFESGDFAYGALVGDDKVAILESGDRAWIGISSPTSGCQ